ncbi:tripartite tricarboxylate transporter TctB family protein [Oceaniovalibus sp. ACAM 378]|uniref:tripartite tricarboxylate transporter TctB family protein n=1 Tax=Oceaniovalibus sp. ACAM 378 TaxID=2599923 RepID=UPI0011D4732D|nr:tripartite tricarboxylate transporter TctB family protein [Oceaniovalibus sp. ACAM 378]TYB85738.1 tripartite tricarboxylate transporter TctB family protein [Oceaniovalibus sp. ACAM 378]
MTGQVDTRAPIDTSTLVAGGIMRVIGTFATWDASTMQLGTPRRMGPGVYPMMIGVGCIVLGALISLLETRLIALPEGVILGMGSAAP